MSKATKLLSRRRQSVLFFSDLRCFAMFEKLAGISEFERKLGRSVHFVYHTPATPPLAKFLEYWNPVGIISDSVRYSTKPGDRSCPTVFIDVDPSEVGSRYCTVQHDSVEAGRMAAREFLQEGFENFAYIENLGRSYWWAEERRRGFEEVLATQGRKANIYAGLRTHDEPIAVQSDICQWICSLPKPCAVFAATDEVAENVLAACLNLGVGVPDDIAVIGVDNDESICEHTLISLSSVAPAFRDAGRSAARLLEDIRKTGKARSTRFGSSHIVRRESSRMLRRPDCSVRRVLEAIRREACLGMKARDAIAMMGCSRRTAEMRFRTATGLSVLEAINQVRYERLLELLKDKNVSLDEAAAKCAFASATMMSRFFAKRMGMPPSAWRAGYCN